MKAVQADQEDYNPDPAHFLESGQPTEGEEKAIGTYTSRIPACRAPAVYPRREGERHAQTAEDQDPAVWLLPRDTPHLPAREAFDNEVVFWRKRSYLVLIANSGATGM